MAQQVALSAKVMYRAMRRAEDRICSSSTAVSPNLAEYDYFLVDKSLAAFAIFQGQSQAS